jgi:hypothetical protein
LKQNWPAILCAIHCALAAVLSALISSWNAHGSHIEALEWTVHNPFIEALEWTFILLALLVLVRTLKNLWHPRRDLFWLGIILVASLLFTMGFLPHGFLAVCMLGIAAYQILVNRLLCDATCHAK